MRSPTGDTLFHAAASRPADHTGDRAPLQTSLSTALPSNRRRTPRHLYNLRGKHLVGEAGVPEEVLPLPKTQRP